MYDRESSPEMLDENEIDMTVNLDASLIDALRLETDPDSEWAWMAISGSSGKVSSILDCALVLAAEHFPVLTMATWNQLLCDADDFLNGDLPAAQILSPGFLTQIASRGMEEWYLSDDEADTLASLCSAELFAVHLVVDRFLSQADDQQEDLRDILAAISHRPREFVFKEDFDSANLRLVR